MRVEYIIYFYGAVCCCMIVFNLVYNLLLKGSQRRMERRCREIKDRVDAQLARLQRGQPVTPEHLRNMRRKLCSVNYLIAFHRVLDETFDQPCPLENAYLRQVQPVILYLAVVYRKKEAMQAGYFTYFLSHYTVKRQMQVDSLQDILLDYVGKENLYCRINALSALYYFANIEHIVSALKLQDDGKVFLHEKILTEGLLSYTGDHNGLISQLWKQLPSFSPHTQLAILNYIRFQSGGYEKEMYAIMVNEDADKELRLSAIRYFGKYEYMPALGPLLNFAGDKDPSRWEFATVAVSSLSTYSGQPIMDALKEALRSRNWYIRYAAAQALEHHHVDYSDVIDIAAGDDRYAREMMMYRLESRKLQEQGV